MAVVINPIDINANTFLDWVVATNNAIDVISANSVTTGGIPAVGDAVVTGNIQTDGLFADTLSGGDIGTPTNITITSLSTFANNIVINGNINANGVNGPNGSVLMSNGSNVYWLDTSTQPFTSNGITVTGTANSSFNTNLLFINPTSQRVGVRTTTPAYTFDVNGSLNATTVYSNNAPVWTNANHGAGSGLNADLLDGLHANNFILRNAASNTNSTVTFTAGVLTNTINAVSVSTDNITFNGNRFGFSQPSPVYKVDIGGTLRASGSAYFSSNVYFGVTGSPNKVGVLDLLKTNTSTLSGNVTISTDGNKVTFFENGGSNRGAFIDLGGANNSVSSQIWHSGLASLLSATIGYQRLPSGLIMQWGRAGSSTNDKGTKVITFPIAFNTACYNVQVTAINSQDFESGVTAIATTTSFTFRNDAGRTLTDFYWFAIGV